MTRRLLRPIVCLALIAGCAADLAPKTKANGDEVVRQAQSVPADVAAAQSSDVRDTVLAVGGVKLLKSWINDSASKYRLGSPTWSSGNTAVLAVSRNGLARGVAPGRTEAKAVAGRFNYEVSIRVVRGPSDTTTTGGGGGTPTPLPVKTIVVTLAASALQPGQTTQASASARDSLGAVLSGKTFTWSSSAPNIATVSGAGLVTAVAAGTTSIQAVADGVTGSASLTVTAAPPPPPPTPAKVKTVTVTLAASSISVGQSTQATAVAKDSVGNVLSGKTIGWSSSATTVASVSAAGLANGLAAGNAAIQATIDGVAGAATLAVASATTPSPGTVSTLSPVVPELPRVTVDSRMVAPTGRTIPVAPTEDLQVALDTVRPGDVIELVAGAVYTAPSVGFGLRKKSTPGWITIRTATTLPPEGTRFVPGSANLAKILGGLYASPVIYADPGASNYRFVGVEIGFLSTVAFAYSIVQLGDGRSTQFSLSQVPSNFVFDRVWVHGHDGVSFQRCLSLNAINVAVVESTISDCHSNGFDSQAILAWNSPGPFKIENNTLSGAGEIVMFGGGDAASVDFLPRDIVIRRNHFTRPTSWQGKWVVKNLLELKVGIRVLIEGNVFENNWANGQDGMAILFRSLNQDGTAPFSETRDVTMRNNLLRNSPAGINLAATISPYAAVPMSRVRIENNVLDGVGTFAGSTNGRMLLILGGPQDIAVYKNTFVHNVVAPVGSFITTDGVGPGRNLVIRSNVSTEGNSGGAVFGSGTPSGVASIAAISTPYAFDLNLFIGPNTLQFKSLYAPESNYFAASTADAGFLSATNYQLSAGSPFRGLGVGGADPGADIAAVNNAIAGVVR